MKIMSFSATEKLPMLLDPNRKEFQSMRPAWQDSQEQTTPESEKIIMGGTAFWRDYKPPTFNPGERVQIWWKQQDTQHNWYCQKCGNYLEPEYDLIIAHCNTCNGMMHLFQKKMGVGKIKEISRVEMGKDMDGYFIGLHGIKPGEIVKFWNHKGDESCQGIIDGLAKRDGFSDSNEMFEYFNKNYDLSTRKPFWVYRGEKISSEV